MKSQSTRRTEAAARTATCAARRAVDQMLALDFRLGFERGAKRERARLLRLIGAAA